MQCMSENQVQSQDHLSVIQDTDAQQIPVQCINISGNACLGTATKVV